MGITALKAALAIIVLTLVAACSPAPELTLVSFHEFAGPSRKAHDAAGREQSAVHKAGGALSGPVLFNRRQLHNTALPTNTKTLKGSLVTFVDFASRQELEIYLEKRAFAEGRPELPLKAQFITRKLRALPKLPDPQPLTALNKVRGPRFILINSIKMGSLINPANPVRMMKFMNTNMKTLSDLGITFIEPLKVEKVLSGPVAPNMLFLTIWPSQRVFDDVHRSEDFKTLVKGTRNRVFREFTEDKAHVIRRAGNS